MKVWLRHHLAMLAATVGRFVGAPVATLLNAGVIGIALALPAGLYVGLANLQGYARAITPEPEISVFMARDATRDQATQVESRLRAHDGVRSVRFVPRDEALAELKATTGLADVVGGLTRNPLPDAFVVQARDTTPQALEALRRELAGWPRIDHVQLDALWAQRLDAGLRLARLAVLLLATLFAFALVAVSFNTIRLQILTRREEIEVSKLIGATDPFIRLPFLYFGTLQGLVAGLAAWLIVWVGLQLFNLGLGELSGLYGASVALRHLGLADSLSLLAFSACLGWFGAWLSVNRHLAEIEPH